MSGNGGDEAGMQKTVLLTVLGPDRPAGFKSAPGNMVPDETTVGGKTLNKIRP